MAQNTYYPEEVLIEKMECGEYGWLDYVNHFSADWQEELEIRHARFRRLYRALKSEFSLQEPEP